MSQATNSGLKIHIPRIPIPIASANTSAPIASSIPAPVLPAPAPPPPPTPQPIFHVPSTPTTAAFPATPSPATAQKRGGGGGRGGKRKAAEIPVTPESIVAQAVSPAGAFLTPTQASTPSSESETKRSRRTQVAVIPRRTSTVAVSNIWSGPDPSTLHSSSPPVALRRLLQCALEPSLQPLLWQSESNDMLSTFGRSVASVRQLLNSSSSSSSCSSSSAAVTDVIASSSMTSLPHARSSALVDLLLTAPAVADLPEASSLLLTLPDSTSSSASSAGAESGPLSETARQQLLQRVVYQRQMRLWQARRYAHKQIADLRAEYEQAVGKLQCTHSLLESTGQAIRANKSIYR